MNKPKWYLGQVKEKQNHTWSEVDKLKILSLKESHSAAQLAEMYQATITQIYNVVRIAKAGLENKCFMCGEPLKGKEIEKNKNKLVKACDKCKANSKAYKQVLRKKALKKKLCGYCGKHPVIKGFKACKFCISATYRRRKKLSLCGRCGKHPHEPKTSLCILCLNKNKNYSSEYRNKHKIIEKAQHSS